MLLLFMSIAVSLLFLEWALRFLNIQRLFPLNPPIFRTSADPRVSYELIPSIRAHAYATTVTTNGLGFRSPPIPAGKPLIAMLGDSVTFGQGVEDDQTTPHYLETMLPGFAVLNAGVGGYNIEQEKAQYEDTVKALKPKAIILTFVFNDFDETLALGEQGYLHPRSQKPTHTFEELLNASINKPGTIPIPGKLFLQTHSAVFTFLERATKGLSFRSHAARESIFSDTVTQTQVERYRQSLHELAVAAGDTPRLFVIWPEESLHLSSRDLLKQMAVEEGFHVVDLYEIFGNHYGSLGWDGHPNARTNQQFAKVLAQALIAFKLLPSTTITH